MDLCGITDLFEENFTNFGELGASVCIWYQDKKILNLDDGYQDREKRIPWDAQSIVLIWSATKGLASATLLHVVERHGIDLDRRIIDFWPEYGKSGKGATTFRHVLCHQAGQPALRDTSISILDHEAVANQLANQEPFWAPGTTHGYHARTYGFLLDELVRRITHGETLGHYFTQNIANPLGLRLWIGLSEPIQVAPIHAPRKARTGSEEDEFYDALAEPDSLTRKAFSTPAGLHSPSLMNDPKIREHSLPSLGGIGSADSLANFYQALGSGRILSADRIQRIADVQCSGPDQILKVQTAFGIGFMKDPVVSDRKVREIFGTSFSSFGQPGSGGSLAFFDLENQLAFAYVMNQMEPGVFPNAKALRLVRHLYATLP
jgi:CubicO group peptidase (beta-lactamase class C family)